jgi:SAM-dependent methyltransferase
VGDPPSAVYDSPVSLAEQPESPDPGLDPEQDEQGAPYDAIADGYARHWGPVIEPAAVRVLDDIAPVIEAILARGGVPRIVDVGAGTGALAIAALERWPAAEVLGIDPSGAMLDLAEAAAVERLGEAVADQLETQVAWADELPLDDGVVDVVVSSFVLQLVDNRAAALREVRRVLRPGGTFAWVAWLRGGQGYEPDRIADRVLDDFGFDPPEEGGPNGDLPSPRSAADGMRRAGFRDVQARADELAHPWPPASYLGFLTEFDEASLFADLEAAERHDIERRIRSELEQLEQLEPDRLILRLPVVYASGRAPG